MKFAHRCLVLVSLVLLSSCTTLLTPLITPKVNTDIETLRAGQYRLDHSHAALIFKVQHLGLSTYVGRFNRIEANLDFEPENLAETALSAEVDIASLDINDQDLSDDLMGHDWFNQKTYPKATLVTESVSRIGDNKMKMIASLKFRGVQKLIELEGTFHGGATNILTGKYTLGFSAVGSFRRSDFGMSKFIPLVGDEVTIEAYGEFQKE